MIKANHSKLHYLLLNAYINFITKTDFRKVQITGQIQPDNRSILLITNHFSWWDGFFAWYVNERVFKKRYHVMMLEDELAKRMFFTRVGAFSVNLNSRSIIDSLNYCASILANPNNLLLMFPQGKLESMHKWEIKFQKGVERIVNMAPNTRIVFAACLTDYYSNRRPSLTIALREFKGRPNVKDMEMAFNNHLQQSIFEQDKLYY
jgi:hypothetical protein